MSRVFVTGSADGLGYATAAALLDEGHRVVVHVRDERRLDAVQGLVARGADTTIGDLADLAQTRALAEQVNALGTMDAIVHNAGVYSSSKVMAVNVVAPYVLTALVRRPSRLVYLSSGMHRGGRAKLDGIDWLHGGSYSDSKLFISVFAAAVARLWPDVLSNSVDPGWVATKMGGPNAPDDLRLGHVTQAWLATSDATAEITGGYWHHQQRVEAHPAVHDVTFQTRLVDALAAVTGVVLSSRER